MPGDSFVYLKNQYVPAVSYLYKEEVLMTLEVVVEIQLASGSLEDLVDELVEFSPFGQ